VPKGQSSLSTASWVTSKQCLFLEYLRSPTGYVHTLVAVTIGGCKSSTTTLQGPPGSLMRFPGQTTDTVTWSVVPLRFGAAGVYTVEIAVRPTVVRSTMSMLLA